MEDGELRPAVGRRAAWTSEEAGLDGGAIDIKKALGVWLLGLPEAAARHPARAPDFRSDDDAVLQKWIKLLEDLAPEKPVSEIRNGWMERRAPSAAVKALLRASRRTSALLHRPSPGQGRHRP